MHKVNPRNQVLLSSNNSFQNNQINEKKYELADDTLEGEFEEWDGICRSEETNSPVIKINNNNLLRNKNDTKRAVNVTAAEDQTHIMNQSNRNDEIECLKSRMNLYELQ